MCQFFVAWSICEQIDELWFAGVKYIFLVIMMVMTAEN
jgi:hypothetical protein